MDSREYGDFIEAALDEALAGGRPARLHEAMRYAVGAGGKRIRPKLCLAAAVAAGGCAEDAKWPAVAVELLHNYTLVHDDLPAMDGDELRRGKPSVWVKYGEADAILAGDALQALAFGMAARSPRGASEAVAELARRGVGVVEGQVEDVAHEKRAEPLDVNFVYERKTADLFMAAAVLGGIAAGAGPETLAKLREYAFHLGLAFQFRDDILDGDGSLSREEAAAMTREHTEKALAALAGLPGQCAYLERLAGALESRGA